MLPLPARAAQQDGRVLAPRRRAAPRVVEARTDPVAGLGAADPAARRRRRLRAHDVLARKTPRRRPGRGVVALRPRTRPRRGACALVLRRQARLAFAPDLRLPALE